ncbi:MAG TPA: YggS family pyridoxal phosphate-dependent enzyme [Candidatus Baltobacteraceae bacterium]|nr:YggS family pyridoxal phosphate-dependent enzyme [Candidatus Baltobacteraceae bacterium]
MAESIGARYRRLRAEIDAQALFCGREPASVHLLGVSKKQSADAVREAIAAGLQAIGENYVQEAKAKFAALGAVEKHYIGHIQTNKARSLVELFDVVQSVDREEAARALGSAAAKAGKRLRVLVQLNISPTERFGVTPDEALALAECIHSQEALVLDGVMAIGPVGVSVPELNRAFASAAKTLGRIGGTTLSIGMSGDWREAIAAGSTMVRIGTALFGARREG